LGNHTNAPASTEDTAHEPSPNDGSAEAGKPQGTAKAGKPEETAKRNAATEPTEAGDERKATQPAEPAETTARVRRESRAGSGTESPPPASQETRPPAAANAKTKRTADTRHDPEPAEPNAAKHDKEDNGKTPDNAADKTNESAPTQQPTETAPICLHKSITSCAYSSLKSREPTKENISFLHFK